MTEPNVAREDDMSKFGSLLAVAALGSSAAVAAATLISPLAPAYAGSANIADARIEMAFASATVQGDGGDPAMASVPAKKGDMLRRPSCADQVWPNIAPNCLVTADGAAPRAVRYVTIGYQSDPSTTVLVRMPALEVAAR
jgi:hypothetical protein